MVATESTGCECNPPSFPFACQRHGGCVKTERFHQLCKTNLLKFIAYENGDKSSCLKMNSPPNSIGLGDVAAFLIRIATFGFVKMCPECGKRKARWNRVQVWPIRWPSISLPRLTFRRTLRGYDVDGVLVPRKVQPIGRYVVITGRKESKDRARTISEIGDAAPIYLRPDSMGADGDAVAAGNWKAQKINELGVTEFYEDDETQAAIIREKCPQCRVEIVL